MIFFLKEVHVDKENGFVLKIDSFSVLISKYIQDQITIAPQDDKLSPFLNSNSI